MSNKINKAWEIFEKNFIDSFAKTQSHNWSDGLGAKHPLPSNHSSMAISAVFLLVLYPLHVNESFLISIFSRNFSYGSVGYSTNRNTEVRSFVVFQNKAKSTSPKFYYSLMVFCGFLSAKSGYQLGGALSQCSDLLKTPHILQNNHWSLLSSPALSSAIMCRSRQHHSSSPRRVL